MVSQSTTDLIQTCLESNVLLFGSFTLKSGRISPYFFNAGLLYSGSQLATLATCFAQAIIDSGIEFDVLFGPAYKGIALAAITVVELQRLSGKSVGFAYNRKEAKTHGEGGSLVGAPMKGKRVMILDDVITAGTAIREAITLIKQEGGQLVGITESLDRQERGKEKQESAVQEIEKETGVSVLAVMTLKDIIGYLEGKEDMQDHLEGMRKYQAEYGVV